VTAPTLTTAVALADQLLADFPARAAERQAPGDWGVPLLAGLRAGRTGTGPASAAVAAWAAGLRGGIDHCGLFGRGLAGCLLGLTHASAVEPRLARPAATVRRHVVARCAAAGLRRSGVGWSDYDLIMGVSGAVLALAACPGEAADLEPAARYLLDLCDRDDLARLVVGDDYGNPGLSWNLGRLNHGLGHGVPGGYWPRCSRHAPGCPRRGTTNSTGRSADWPIIYAGPPTGTAVAWSPGRRAADSRVTRRPAAAGGRHGATAPRGLPGN